MAPVIYTSVYGWAGYLRAAAIRSGDSGWARSSWKACYNDKIANTR